VYLFAKSKFVIGQFPPAFVILFLKLVFYKIYKISKFILCVCACACVGVGGGAALLYNFFTLAH